MQSLELITESLKENSGKAIPVNIEGLCGEFSDRLEGEVKEGMKPVISSLVVLSEERADFMNKILKNLELCIQKQDYQSKHILTGFQGVGKSYTLLLLAHYLSLPQVKKTKIHVVVIAQCELLSEKRWEYVVNQCKLAFPDEAIFFEELVFKVESKQKLKLDLFIRNKVKNGEIVAVIVDQINWAYGKGKEILEDILTFGWSITLLSESANNNIPENKVFKRYKLHNINHFIPKNLLKAILNSEINSYSPNTEEFNKIFETSNGIPREAILICRSKGSTMEEKINKYENKRKIQLMEIHMKLYRNLDASNQIFLMKSIFYMDKDIFIPFSRDPVIDKQLMCYEKGEGRKFKIFSVMPLANEVLKKYLAENDEIYDEKRILSFHNNFYNQRINEIYPLLIDSNTDSITRGILFEELIILKLRDSCVKKKEICLLAQSVLYLKRHCTHNMSKSIEYNVI